MKGRPPASWARRASASVIALAIHTASRCEARPVSAVTRPPPPRLTEPSSWKVTGPRLETRTSGARSVSFMPPRGVGGSRSATCARGRAGYRGRSRGWFRGLLLGSRRGRRRRRGRGEQFAEDAQVVAQVPRGQEVLADMLLAAAPEGLPEGGVTEDVEGAGGAGLHVTDQIPGDAVLDLQGDTANVTADERPRLPQRLADREPEALARRLLDDDVGVRLEGVDLDRPDVV